MNGGDDAFRHHIVDCDEWKEKHEERAVEIEKAVERTQWQLENGRHRFQEMEGKIEMLTPKPIKLREILFPLVSLIMAVGAIFWNVVQNFDKRPTFEMVSKMIESSIKPTDLKIDALREDIRELKDRTKK